MLTLSPSQSPQQAVVGVPICFEGSGIVVIPQTPEASLDIPSSGSHFTYDGATLTKTSGGSTYTDCTITSDDTVYGLQPFYIKACNSSAASATDDVSWYIAAVTDSGVIYAAELFKYGVGSQWFLRVYIIDSGVTQAIYTSKVNFNEIFYIRSDGIYLYFEHVDAGILRRDVTLQLPATTTWSFQVADGGVGNQINCLSIYKGSYQGKVPITWTNPDGGTLVVTGNTACLTASPAGTYSICVDSDFDDPVCVDIDVAALYFDPISIGCTGCVFTDTVVHFESNGGLAGTLVAVVDGTSTPVGTVIDALTWQAPSIPRAVKLTYTIGGTHVDCVLHVVDRLQVLNVVGDTITGLVPGDQFQILTNYESPNVIWENLSCPNTVTADGVVSIPRRLNDDCFGALDCYIRGRLVTIPGQSCTNLTTGEDQVYIDLHVISDPIYPTPEFGGPSPLKWKPETPDYRVIINEFEGGCDETYLRNRVGVYKWAINYNGLIYEADSPCPPEPCCDEEQGFIDGFDGSFQTAKRLDDFWNRVAGNAGYFTLKDIRTGIVWKRVRFDGTMERDHINWRRTHSRNVNLVWHPCCATYPLGGVCVHNSIITDVFPPTVPQNLTVDIISYHELFVHWDSSVDAIGVKGYILSVDGEELDLGNALSYQHLNLDQNSTHEYRVKAYDFSGNICNYSDTVEETTPIHDITPPLVPNALSATTVTTSRIDLSWTNAGDDVATTGYFVLLDGIAVNVGNVTTYSHTGLTEGTMHTYSVRAYDAAGNRSAWSPSVSATTFPAFLNGLVLGNSMTIIPVPNNTTWWGTWGMAASTQANDFVHQLASLMSTYSPGLTFNAQYCLDWELNHTTFNYSVYDSFFSGINDIDLIIIRLGENVGNLDSKVQKSAYRDDLKTFINYCKAKAPGARVILTGNYWEGDIAVKDSLHYAAAQACNVPFVSFEYLDTAANRSFIGATVSGDDAMSHTVADGPVAAHPADGGHAAKAGALYDGIYGITPKLTSIKVDAGRTSGGVVSGYSNENSYFLLGSALSSALTVDTSLISTPPPTSIWNTSHYADHQQRYGGLEANIAYKIEFFTCAPSPITGAGQRTFSVSVNGLAKDLTGPLGTFSSYDAWYQAGGAQNKGTVASCTALTTVGGFLTIDFATSNNGQIMGTRVTKL